ncbi:MAG: GNAT family N-acetyltransferase [Woeseiaceae bacterium]
MTTRIRLAEEVPAVKEYMALRIAAGLDPKSPEAAKLGLPNSLFAVCVRDDAQLIGMGRIVGDGGCNFEVVDIAVHPDWQRRGIGYQVMQSLIKYLEANAPPSAYVSLIADGDASRLYEKFGFEFTSPESVSMALAL